MKKFYLFILLFGAVHFISAQTPLCYTDQIWAEMVRKDSSLLFERNKNDAFISQKNNSASISNRGERATSAPTIIPTVLYIISDGSFNLSMQQIQSQMDQLNATYSGYGYEFCYAKRNIVDTSFFAPSAGDSAGVFRINNALTNVDQTTQDAALKAISTLPSQNYMRIFVVNSITPVGVLGYAFLPGTNTAQDGIVIRANVFGSRNYCPTCNLMNDYDLGASLIHEVGHYLNLYHTFQGGCYTVAGPPSTTCQLTGDWVCDTPPTEGSFGCPSIAPLSCDSANFELIQNFMDYTTDRCKTSFTDGQKTRMNNSLPLYRATLISTQNLINTGVTCISFAGQYAQFDAFNFSGCLNDTMVFTSLNNPGFTYYWNFGDGDTSNAVNGIHAYKNTGLFQVTLTAVNTGMNISETSMENVYITSCHPIACAYSKWSAGDMYLDFSSGKPLIINHSNPKSEDFLDEYFSDFFRGDNAGNFLFYLHTDEETKIFFCDTSYSIIDSGDYFSFGALVPSPQANGKYYYVAAETPMERKVGYTVFNTSNGTPALLPNRREVTIPFSDTISSVDPRILAIPNCDGSQIWFCILRINGDLAICETGANDTILIHQLYHIPGISSYNIGLTASPDGRKLIFRDINFSNNSSWLYVLDFNKSIGMITSYKSYPLGAATQLANSSTVPSMFFSPNSRFFYTLDICCNSSNQVVPLYQYDIYSSDIIGTRKQITTFPSSRVNQTFYISSGPDNKIYLSGNNWSNGSFHLSVINNPDMLEDGANEIGFIERGPSIITPYSFLGDASFEDFAATFGCNWKPNVPPGFNFIATQCHTYQFNSDDCFDHKWNFGDPASGTGDTSTESYPAHTFSSAGVYRIRLVANGYTFTDTVRIDSIDLHVASSNLSLCPDVHANYSVAFIQPSVTYNWNITNGSPAYVSSATNVDVHWNGTTGTGEVTVTAINANGCADTANLPVSWQGIICDSVATGITNLINNIADIIVYPNPSTGNWTLNVAADLIGSDLNIYDERGRLVMHSIVATQKSEINLQVTAGIYYMHIDNAIITVVRKLVKL